MEPEANCDDRRYDYIIHGDAWGGDSRHLYNMICDMFCSFDTTSQAYTRTGLTINMEYFQATHLLTHTNLKH